ncbi:sigma-70 RNA polymerase sigma factor region 4 domain-containing protein [Oceanobacillus profundus]|uniref:Sigma-70 family RNA polymerase sigma factor n=1 Tax=Oceanobacillus profundus TaxID=372463 RepID=A0A417YJP1_9BACI|nr:sigma-70 family RNA polymerase sigma factor [Oceanobacillus profundus]RHW33534.1 sigma-70 family RNA polymerase sigma factor [Oceanobacillus profundus]
MKKQVEDLIYQYYWRKKEVSRICSILWRRYSLTPSAGMVSKYGIEATLPKANTSLKSYAEMDALDARDKRLYDRYKDYEEIVKAIESIANYLEDEQQKIILDCMMEGMSYRSIADHLGINRNKIRLMKEKMLCQICQKCHFLHDLIDKKTA